MKFILILILEFYIIKGDFISKNYEMFEGKSIEELQTFFGILPSTEDENVPVISYTNFLKLVAIPE